MRNKMMVSLSNGREVSVPLDCYLRATNAAL